MQTRRKIAHLQQVRPQDTHTCIHLEDVKTLPLRGEPQPIRGSEMTEEEVVWSHFMCSSSAHGTEIAQGVNNTSHS